MNKNINLIKILKDCPKETKFWSPLYDEVRFSRICHPENGIIVSLKTNVLKLINSDATVTLYDIKSPTIMLYPSKEQRDWSKFTAPWYKKERFDPNTLKPFDRVIVRDEYDKWTCTLFSHISNKPDTCFMCVTCDASYIYCIPYNDDTKHLIGTASEAPEFYRYWED